MVRGHAVRRGRVLALICLAIFLVWEVSGLLRNAWHARFDSLLVAARLDERSIRQSSLPFDLDYGPFLEAVRGATPPGATVALFVPETMPLYTYQASYVLTPRILVGPARLSEASYAAVYGSRTAPGVPISLPVRKGTLFRLR
jgi:hypothetical protein